MEQEKKAILKNQYGEKVCDMVPDGDGYYSLPENFATDCFQIGDVYSVVEAKED